MTEIKNPNKQKIKQEAQKKLQKALRDNIKKRKIQAKSRQQKD